MLVLRNRSSQRIFSKKETELADYIHQHTGLMSGPGIQVLYTETGVYRGGFSKKGGGGESSSLFTFVKTKVYV